MAKITKIAEKRLAINFITASILGVRGILAEEFLMILLSIFLFAGWALGYIERLQIRRENNENS